MFNRKKTIFIGILLIIVLLFTYMILGRQMPIHRSDMKVGDEKIYYQETSRLMQCDLAYIEVVVYEDENYEYVYELISVGNGSCLSELYVWDDLKYYTLDRSIEEDIVSLGDFLKSDFVIQRPLNTGE